jgi:transketolase
MLTEQDKSQLHDFANAIRVLSMDAVQAADSGHPGLPMGCAEIGAYLFGKALRFNPANPLWAGRDRFVLSAGHGSMLLYSCLHLTGQGTKSELPLDELKRFRQLGSLTPGHPEYGHTVGVETTTGPLGQGMANAAGMALAQKIVAARLGLDKTDLLDGLCVALCGDGCMMEGITNEAASLSAHLGLDNFVVIYDSNSICLDGPTSECFTEDTAARYKALGWRVLKIDGAVFEEIDKAITTARKGLGKGQPTLIVAKTIIANGAPTMAGTSKAHGSPLGAEEVKRTKEALGLSPDAFAIPESVRPYCESRLPDLQKLEDAWNRKFKKWAKENPDQERQWNDWDKQQQSLPEDFDAQVRAIEIAPNCASRKSSNLALQKLQSIVPFLTGGSADLSCSDLTMMAGGGIVRKGAYGARNIKFGVREFAMSAMTNGIALEGRLLPFCGTFLTFSDYMRNAIRLACMMKIHVVYQFTHDSVGVGEDGPTHQPVEHVASLRAIPGMTLIRPADTNEVRAAWSWTIAHAKGPVVLILTRQNLRDLPETAVPTAEGIARGGYVVRQEAAGRPLDYCLLASGSEVAVALDAAANLAEQGKSVRVVSMPCLSLFDAQPKEYRDATIPREAGQFWALEAGVEQGWHKYIGRDGHTVCMHSFGTSAPLKAALAHFGFTPEKVLERIAAEA